MSELKVEKHKVVSFAYSLMDEKGHILEQNEAPTDYVHGSNDNTFPPVMADALEGAAIGETKKIQLPPEMGYGRYDENKTYRAKIEDMPKEYHSVGKQATFKDVDGKELLMTVMSVDNGEVFLDGNHPFAGKTLTVSMTVKAIRDATEEEIGSGLAARYQQNQTNNDSVH